MGTGRAPTALEAARIKDNYKDPQQGLFVSMGSNHEERVKNYVSYLDRQIEEQISENSSSDN